MILSANREGTSAVIGAQRLRWISVHLFPRCELIALLWLALIPRTCGATDIRGLISDDFNDGRLASVWAPTGTSVTVSRGHLRISTDVTDAGGRVQSGSFPVSSTDSLIFSRRHNIHRGNDKYDYVTSIIIDGDAQSAVGISYSSYDYNAGDERSVAGIHLLRNGASAHARSRAEDISNGIDGIWDTWFEEKFVYVPATGTLDYFVDGALRISFETRPVTDRKKIDVSLSLSPWAGCGHHTEIDYINLRVGEAPQRVVSGDVLPTAPRGPFLDAVGLVTQREADELSRALSDFRSRTGIEFVVAVLASHDGELSQYSRRIYEQWRVGERTHDRGILFIVFPRLREARLESGPGLRHPLPDVVASRILRRMTEIPREQAAARLAFVIQEVVHVVEPNDRLGTTATAQHEVAAVGGNGDGLHRWAKPLVIPICVAALLVLTAAVAVAMRSRASARQTTRLRLPSRGMAVCHGELCPFSWIEITKPAGCFGTMTGAGPTVASEPQPCLKAQCQLWNPTRICCALADPGDAQSIL